MIRPAPAHPQTAWVTAATIGFAAMTFIQTGNTHITGNDGYYHVKMAALLPELGFVQSFPWLRWTILHEDFVSHHYGFHVLLLPFVYTADYLGYEPAFGGKVSASFAMAAIFGVIYHLLRARGVPFPLVWTCLLSLAPWHFWLRMSYVRAPMAALPLLLLAVTWCVRGRVVMLFLLAFVFTQVYGGAVVFPLVPLGFVIGSLLAREQVRPSIMQLAASCAGVGLGLVISPYFPQNFSFFYTQIFETGLRNPPEVGGEWKPYETWALVQLAAPLAVLWVACLSIRLRTAVRATPQELGIFMVNGLFLLLMLKSRRFVEYWPAFALVNAADFAAVAWRARQAVAPVVLPRTWIAAGAAALFLASSASLMIVRREQRPSHNVSAIRDAMAFLRENSAAGSLVFTDDWDIFPICFYYNHHNTYAVGLDPEFTRSKYPALWERYKRITRAELPAKVPSDLGVEGEDPQITYANIRTQFGAEYVLVADDHTRLYRALSERPHEFQQIYPEKGDAQPPIAIFKIFSPGA